MTMLGSCCVGAAMSGPSSPLAQTAIAGTVNFFPGFRRRAIRTSGTTINALIGGNGPPVLLLHGYPQTHIEWRKIAPELAKNHTVVMTDLRGYGDSGKPDAGSPARSERNASTPQNLSRTIARGGDVDHMSPI
jgi:pimeloyl-ACP methyl ester carboxylesterase